MFEKDNKVTCVVDDHQQINKPIENEKEDPFSLLSAKTENQFLNKRCTDIVKQPPYSDRLEHFKLIVSQSKDDENE